MGKYDLNRQMKPSKACKVNVTFVFKHTLCFPVKLLNTWSSTLKHRSLVTESPCMMGGRIYTQQCPYP